MSEQVSNDESALTETEREALWESINFWDDEADNLFPAVERILADRLAAVTAEREEALDRYAEREQRWHWTLIREQNAEGRAVRAEAERDDLRARLAAVEALEPTWPRGMYGCPDDMFSRRDLRAALADRERA